MKKFVVLAVLVLIAQRTSSIAQEIRLDSLWAKQGGVFAMSFSPDSKTLAIGEDGDEGQIRIFDAQTGKERDSIAHSFYVDLAFTPDGQYLLAIDQTGIKFFTTTTYKLDHTISYNQGGNITFSPNGSLLALASSFTIAVVDIEQGVVLANFPRPDKYNTGPNQTNPYWNGKVSFSADGKYIIGKYENSLVRWDWQNAPTKPEILIGSFGNRAIIGFSPDKKYVVQQSNYLWDIQQGKQIAVEGLKNISDETAYGFATTASGSRIVVTGEDHTPKFINPASKKLFSTTPLLYNLLIAISPDSNYFAYQYGNGRTYVSGVKWGSSGVVETSETPLQIKINPQPVNSNITITITTDKEIANCRILIVNTIGITVADLHNGSINMGNQLFNLSTTSLPSGNYFVRVLYGNQEVSYPFIITK